MYVLGTLRKTFEAHSLKDRWTPFRIWVRISRYDRCAFAAGYLSAGRVEPEALFKIRWEARNRKGTLLMLCGVQCEGFQ